MHILFHDRYKIKVRSRNRQDASNCQVYVLKTYFSASQVANWRQNDVTTETLVASWRHFEDRAVRHFDVNLLPGFLSIVRLADIFILFYFQGGIYNVVLHYETHKYMNSLFINSNIWSIYRAYAWFRSNASLWG